MNGFVSANGLHERGLHIEGVKYFCLRADDRSIYGKQVRHPLPRAAPPPIH